MRTWPWTSGLLVGLVACQGQSVQSSTTGSASVKPSTTPSVVVPAVSAAPIPKSYPADLNLADVVRKLGCKQGKAKDACAVCKEFETAGRFTGDTPSGQGRWFGKAYRVQKGEQTTEYWVLVSRHVPTATVGPSSLPLSVSIAPVPSELWVEGARLFSSMSHSRHRGSRRNLAMKFVEAYEPKEGQGAINTTGASVQLIAAIGQDIGYLRQPSLKRLLVVRPSRAMDAAPGDGVYAELWQAAW